MKLEQLVQPLTQVLSKVSWAWVKSCQISLQATILLVTRLDALTTDLVYVGDPVGCGSDNTWILNFGLGGFSWNTVVSVWPMMLLQSLGNLGSIYIYIFFRVWKLGRPRPSQWCLLGTPCSLLCPQMQKVKGEEQPNPSNNFPWVLSWPKHLPLLHTLLPWKILFVNLGDTSPIAVGTPSSHISLGLTS